MSKQDDDRVARVVALCLLFVGFVILSLSCIFLHNENKVLKRELVFERAMKPWKQAEEQK